MQRVMTVEVQGLVRVCWLLIEVAMKPSNTVRQALVRPKDHDQVEDQAGVVYQSPAKNAPPSILVRQGDTSESALRSTNEPPRKVTILSLEWQNMCLTLVMRLTGL